MGIRTTYQRAAAGYDPDFERALVDELGTTLATASLCTDTKVMAVRISESIGALTTILAGLVALTPAAARSPTATRKLIDQIAKDLRRQVAQARADSEVRDFVKRCFRNGDVRGRA
jgi:hypothetical protein